MDLRRRQAGGRRRGLGIAADSVSRQRATSTSAGRSETLRQPTVGQNPARRDALAFGWLARIQLAREREPWRVAPVARMSGCGALKFPQGTGSAHGTDAVLTRAALSAHTLQRRPSVLHDDGLHVQGWSLCLALQAVDFSGFGGRGHGQHLQGRGFPTIVTVQPSVTLQPCSQSRAWCPPSPTPGPAPVSRRRARTQLRTAGLANPCTSEGSSQHGDAGAAGPAHRGQVDIRVSGDDPDGGDRPDGATHPGDPGIMAITTLAAGGGPTRLPRFSSSIRWRHRAGARPLAPQPVLPVGGCLRGPASG